MVGLEVLFCAVKSQLQGPEDALICSFHWQIVSAGFKCIGNGEEDPGKDVRGSEMLPEGWNASRDLYTLCYRHAKSKDVYVLKVIRMDDSLLMHLLRLKDERVSTITIRTADYASRDLSTFTSTYLKQEEMQRRFREEILGEMQLGGTGHREASPARRSTAQDQTSSHHDPLRVPTRHPSRQPQPDWNDPGDPFSIGRGDLDPLAGGGGMVFDPLRSAGSRPRRGDPSFGIPGQLPRGAVPPGARFDPFGPPDLDFDGRPRRGGRTGPDPDHMPPPGFDDDMFM